MEMNSDRRGKITLEFIQKCQHIKGVAQEVLDENLPILKGMGRVLAIAAEIDWRSHPELEEEFSSAIGFIESYHSSFDHLPKVEIEALDFSGYTLSSQMPPKRMTRESTARDWEIAMGTEGEGGVNLKGDLKELIETMGRVISSVSRQ